VSSQLNYFHSYFWEKYCCLSHETWHDLHSLVFSNETVHNLEDIALATDQLKNTFKTENTLWSQQMVESTLYLWLQQTSWEWCDYAQIMPNAYQCWLCSVCLMPKPSNHSIQTIYTSYILCWPILEPVLEPVWVTCWASLIRGCPPWSVLFSFFF